MDADLRLIRRIGTDLLGFSIMRRSKIAIEVLLSLPGRIFGQIQGVVRAARLVRLKQNWSQMVVGLGVAKWGLRPHTPPKDT
jgi:hypothetical protein